MIPRGSWRDVSRRFTMIRWASPKLLFRSHNGCGPTAICIPEPLSVTQLQSLPPLLSQSRRRRRPPPSPSPPLSDRTCSDQLFEEFPSVLISSGLLVQADEVTLLPVVDLIRRNLPPPTVKSQSPCDSGWSQAPVASETGSGSATAFPTERVFLDSLATQNEAFRGLFKSIRHEDKNDNNALSLALKAVRTQNAILSTDLAATQKGVKDLKDELSKDFDDKLAYIAMIYLSSVWKHRNNWLLLALILLNSLPLSLRAVMTKRGKTVAAALNRLLMTKIDQVVEVVVEQMTQADMVEALSVESDDKKGEDSSSRPQPPPDDQNRPSGGSGSRADDPSRYGGGIVSREGGNRGGDGRRRGDSSGSSKRRRSDSGGGSGGRINYGPYLPPKRDAEYWISGKRQF
ncbi:hypothetical protein F511_16265 [Dorcoceras hygrometricum]|uniref:Uncharacterized protein n=1 Tax=Dorcoceras hygrometricum TaxID=472368 RepID=A0A2Z7C0C6_9LAMI|nr:hypothetical protein F511_16265 [Dorcoceras hygrometricum]